MALTEKMLSDQNGHFQNRFRNAARCAEGSVEGSSRQATALTVETTFSREMDDF